MSRRRSIRRGRRKPEGPQKLPLVAPAKSRVGVEPEQAAKVAIARWAKPSVLPNHVKLVLTLDLRQALARGGVLDHARPGQVFSAHRSDLDRRGCVEAPA